jgi:hypothetical protein
LPSDYALYLARMNTEREKQAGLKNGEGAQSALKRLRFERSPQQSLQMTTRETFLTRFADFSQDLHTALPHEPHLSSAYTCALHLSQIKQSPFLSRYTGKRL